MAIEVPIIDLANFPLELEKLAAACTGLGCFRVINHGMPAALPAKMKAAVRSLFEIPADVKLLNVVSSLNGAGYLALDLYESFGIYDATSPADVHSFCSILKASPQQREVICEYVSKLHCVLTGIGCKVAESLGLGGCSFDEWPSHVRLNFCNFKVEDDIGCIGVPAHTDSGFMTLLQEDDCVDGLEIMGSNGNFVPIHPIPGTFLVSFGDVGKVWSNGRLHNLKHRVVCKKVIPRISIAMFLLAPKDDKVEPQPTFIDSNHPNIYPTLIFNEYRKLTNTTGLLAGEILSLSPPPLESRS